MIGRQLDLFGGPPKPPKNIVIEDEPVTPDPVPETVPSVEAEVKIEAQEPVTEEVPAPKAEGVHVQMPSSEASAPSMGFVEVSFSQTEEVETAVPETEQAIMEEPESSSGIAELSGENEETAFGSKETAGIEEDWEEALPADWQEPDNVEEMIIAAEVEADVESLGVPETSVANEGWDELELPDSEPETIVESASISVQEEIIPGEILAIEAVAGDAAPVMEEQGIAGENSQEEKEIAEDGPLNIPADQALYSRQYYTMRETANMFNVNQSLLRFWENEFDILKPKKNRKGDRYFRPDDIKNLELIYHLLRVRKFTISGAKDYLKNRSKSLDTFAMVQRLEKLKLFLQELKTHA